MTSDARAEGGTTSTTTDTTTVTTTPGPAQGRPRQQQAHPQGRASHPALHRERRAASCCARRSLRTVSSRATSPRRRSASRHTSLDAPAGGQRPVTFAFNGGPGSSSVWLHLGPARVRGGSTRATSGRSRRRPTACSTTRRRCSPCPTWCSSTRCRPATRAPSRAARPRTSTASRPTSRASPRSSALWTTRNNRWLSPKFIIGESYGTTRAAALAEHLQSRHGLYPNGLMLISSVLDFATIDFDFRNDRAHVDYLPTYAATAHYHGKHGRKALKTVLAEAEEYAARDYPWALSRGSRLTADGTRRARGAPGRPDRSQRGLRRPGRPADRARPVLHRAAARPATGGRSARHALHRSLASGTAESWDADPSHDAIAGPYAAAWNHYVRSELGYENDLPYTQISSVAHQEWSYKEFEAKPVDVTRQLSRAMRGQPAPQGPPRLRLLRRRHPALRGRGHGGPPDLPAGRSATSSTATTRPAT